jgi:hypothetical protein
VSGAACWLAAASQPSAEAYVQPRTLRADRGADAIPSVIVNAMTVLDR